MMFKETNCWHFSRNSKKIVCLRLFWTEITFFNIEYLFTAVGSILLISTNSIEVVRSNVQVLSASTTAAGAPPSTFEHLRIFFPTTCFCFTTTWTATWHFFYYFLWYQRFFCINILFDSFHSPLRYYYGDRFWADITFQI